MVAAQFLFSKTTKKEMAFDKLKYLGFEILELSMLQLYSSFQDLLRPRFGEDNKKLHLRDTDFFYCCVPETGQQMLIRSICKKNKTFFFDAKTKSFLIYFLKVTKMY